MDARVRAPGPAYPPLDAESRQGGLNVPLDRPDVRLHLPAGKGRAVVMNRGAFLPESARRQATGESKRVSTRVAPRAERAAEDVGQASRRSTATSQGPGTGGDVGRRNQIVDMP